MAKIREFKFDPDTMENGCLCEGWHFNGADGPFGITAHHRIYGYDIDHLIPSPHFLMVQPDLTSAINAALLLSKYPELITDICQWCRNYDYGVNTPRFNIMRGQCHLPKSNVYQYADRRVIPCFCLDMSAPAPPGFDS
jgi:hypothetical protein